MLPRGFGYEWTGQSLQEKLSGSQAPFLLALSALVVFLCLAALYESWTIPLAVLLTVPLGICGAVLAATFRGLPNDVYFTVGLITIIGLAAKDAILIIEFAKDLRAQGKPLIEATLEACALRFRPILMTGLAFVCGVLPMVIATGAGGASQQALGSSVMGGMIAVVVLALLMVPVFFVERDAVFRAGRRGEGGECRGRGAPWAAGACGIAQPGSTAYRVGPGSRTISGAPALVRPELRRSRLTLVGACVKPRKAIPAALAGRSHGCLSRPCRELLC